MKCDPVPLRFGYTWTLVDHPRLLKDPSPLPVALPAVLIVLLEEADGYVQENAVRFFVNRNVMWLLSRARRRRSG